MTEDEIQALMEMGDLVTQPHAEALAAAYALGRRKALAEVIEELQGMHPSIDAAQAATDLKQTYASELDRSKTDG